MKINILTPITIETKQYYSTIFVDSELKKDSAIINHHRCQIEREINFLEYCHLHLKMCIDLELDYNQNPYCNWLIDTPNFELN